MGLYIENHSAETINVRFGMSEVGEIGHKWDKSGSFSDKILVHFYLIS